MRNEATAMFLKPVKTLKPTFLLSLFLSSTSASFALPVDANIFFDGTNTIRVAWNAVPGKIYRLQTSTNLIDPWQDALPFPGTLTATSNQVFQSLPANTGIRFYRVTQLDTDGPEIYQVFPLDGAIAVGQQDVVEARLLDETGINTNTIAKAGSDHGN